MAMLTFYGVDYIANSAYIHQVYQKGKSIMQLYDIKIST